MLRLRGVAVSGVSAAIAVAVVALVAVPVAGATTQFALVHSYSGGSINTSVATPITISVAPAGGDLLVTCIGGSDSSTPAFGTPAGWTVVGSGVVSDPTVTAVYLECWWKVAAGNEATVPESWTGTLTGTDVYFDFSGFVSPSVDLTANANSGATSSGAVASVQAAGVQATQDELPLAFSVFSSGSNYSTGNFGHGANLCTLAQGAEPTSNNGHSGWCESSAQDSTNPAWSMTAVSAGRWAIEGVTFEDGAVETAASDSADTLVSNDSTQIFNYGKDVVALVVAVFTLSVGILMLVRYARKGVNAT